MSFIVTSFFTENTPYEKEAFQLLQSVLKFKMRFHIKPAPSLGTWEKNCQYKAIYILNALKMFDEDILWVDADAVFNGYPILFDEMEGDIGYHYLEHRREILSGTLFLKNNAKVKELVEKWIEINSTNDLWDQKNLQTAIETSDSLVHNRLPAEYCRIYDNKHQHLTTEPVIVHYQASRRFKRQINRGIINGEWRAAV